MASTKDKKSEKIRSPQLIERYKSRITTLKKAHDYASKDNIPKAVEGYSVYLQNVASYYFTEEDKLAPKLFLKDNNTVEILLISQVYWGLSKAYDRSPKLKAECGRCLNQFTLFSIGFRHQYINSELIRKFLRRKIAYNSSMFENAYKKIQVDSKKCYIATYCFGEIHPVTETLREMKLTLNSSELGIQFIKFYYRFSPRFVKVCENNIFWAGVTKFIIKPQLKVLAYFLQRFSRK